MTKKVKNVSDSEFKDLIQDNSLVLVDFYADWCGPCHAIKPALEEPSMELDGRVAFAKIDFDQNKERASEFGIMSIPSLLIFSNGKLVDRLTGALPKEMIKERLDKFIE